ncbi:DUF6573 family protein [Actinomadura bangladeshensis]|uniref:Uncharacterized protein n=1 Tax=Actinomadura bangladeshensis TaxID=453573 RepID=A0A6L9QER8_9ACTN|nr:DUF6573 family protein [Actinomadura bangladeshensis]NEA22664.1 hypothetical protein [Actinomadura bangladeshensis]
MDDLDPGPVIDAHSRADAIAAGQLIEARAELVRDARLRYPVALTRAAWADCVQWTDEDGEETGALQDEDGRLFDVLTMSRAALTRASGDRAVATVHRVPRGVLYREDDADDIPLVYLLVTVAPGDDWKPCITISQLNEED